MDVSEGKRLKALVDENAKLKRMLAEAMLNETPFSRSASYAPLWPPGNAWHNHSRQNQRGQRLASIRGQSSMLIEA